MRKILLAGFSILMIIGSTPVAFSKALSETAFPTTKEKPLFKNSKDILYGKRFSATTISAGELVIIKISNLAPAYLLNPNFATITDLEGDPISITALKLNDRLKIFGRIEGNIFVASQVVDLSR